MCDADQQGENVVRFVSIVALLCVAGLARGQQQGKFVWEEFGDRVASSRQVTALGTDLLGDSISLANGELSFDVTDVAIPGNSSLPVAVGRSYKVFNRRYYRSDRAFADWDIALPKITSVHVTEWNSRIPGKRCSISSVHEARPEGSGLFSAADYWQGNQISIPGQGDEEMLVANSQTPTPATGGPYPWTTAGLIRIGCLPSIRNGSGEGFIATTPDGTRYWFDWMAQYHEPWLRGDYGTAQARRLNALYATRVEDRFGNTVTYTYNNVWDAPVRLTRISGDDGRVLTLSYDGSGHVTSVVDGARTWHYEYAGGGADRRRLSAVTLPDQTQWRIDFAAFTGAEFEYPVPSGGEIVRDCLRNPHILGTHTGTVAHPSGLSGEFTVQIKEHARSNVPVSCNNFSQPHNDPNTNVNQWVTSYHAYSLVSKRLVGAGVDPMEWTYDYSSDASVHYFPGASPGNPICPVGVHCDQIPCQSDDCAGNSRTLIAGPDGATTRHIFGNSYRYNEGKLLLTETMSPAGQVIRRERHAYDLDQNRSTPYPARFGMSPRLNFDGFSSEYHRPGTARWIEQQGHAFRWEADAFDALARPLSVTKSSDVAGSPARIESTRYHDNLSRWVLGLPSRLTVNGLVASETNYDAQALPTVFRQFGKTVQTLAYHADGTVRSVRDGNGHTTTLSNWKRGIPQAVGYPATPESPSGATQTAVVDDHGWITRVTDENGFATHYQYDPIGRLSRITQPTGDAVAWNATTFTFARAAASAYGVPAGHWQHTVATGNGRTVTYLDALWRPVLVREYDTGNASGSQRFARQAFDHEGRVTFASFPSVSGTPATGVWTEYDALGRVRSISQDSEIGLLTTVTDYLNNADGYYTRVTGPRGGQTRTWFQAFDQPSYDSPTVIWHPEDAQTHISRDIFGKPTSIVRRNSNGSVSTTRSYVYDTAQQLCKQVEPETGATIMAYDDAGNLAWSKAGASQTGTASCNTADIPMAQRTVRSYDARNRIQALVFPDNLGNTTYSHTPDSLLASISVDNGGVDIVTTAYTYNRRRLLTGEAVGVGSHQWAIGYGYNANGHLATMILPGGETVAHAPDALGQPTRAGSHATGVSYFPNGAIKQFTYGNGVVRTFTQNARSLPERGRDARGSIGLFDESYDYDGHGNVAAISDGLSSGRGDRTMRYDGLDRLVQTVSPMFGTAAYTYDVLDNLTRVRVGSGAHARDHRYTYDTANRLSLVAHTSGGATVASLGYDAQGNLNSRNGQGYRFDHGNRLRSATGLEHYLYDGHGRRVKATRRGGGAIYSVYGQDGVLRYQRDERRGETMDYVHLNGALVTRLIDPIALSAPALTAPGYSATGGYTVSWTSVALASRYQLRERLDGGSWTIVHDAAGTSAAFSGKDAGTWIYQVRACSTSTCGEWSPEVEVRAKLPPAVAPALSVPTTGLNGAYSVSWGGVSAATTYRLQEQQGSGGWSTVHDAAGTSKAMSGKAAGSWGYRVGACNDTGCGPWSEVERVDVMHPPGTSPALTVPATNITGSYSVTWGAISGASRYTLEERFNSGSWSTIHDAGGTGKAVSGKTTGIWSYRLRACNAAGCGHWSQIVSSAVTRPPTSVPTLTAPASNTSGAYTVSWSAVAHATTYQLQEQLNGGSWSRIHDAGGTSKAISGKASGRWGYRIRGCNAAGCGGWSGVRSTQVTRVPTARTTATVSAPSGTGAFTVSWGTVAGAATYELEERAGSGSWKQIQRSASRSRSVTGKGPGTYRYRVRGCNVAGCGPYSTEATVTLSLPPMPTRLSVSGGDWFCEIGWSASSGATRYELQRGGLEIYRGAQSSAFLSAACQPNQAHRVRACNGLGCSAWSAPVIWTAPGGGGPPGEEPLGAPETGGEE